MKLSEIYFFTGLMRKNFDPTKLFKVVMLFKGETGYENDTCSC